MRPTIEDALTTPGPVTILAEEATIPIDGIADTLRNLVQRFNAIAAGEKDAGNPISFKQQGTGSVICIRSGEDPLSDPSLWLKTDAYLHEPEEDMPTLAREALKAVENYERHPLMEGFTSEAVAEALVEDFFRENQKLDRFPEAKRIHLRSPFDGAKIHTPNEARFRAHPEWSRVFTLVRIEQSPARSGPMLTLSSMSMNEAHPMQPVDAVTRLWATGRIHLFKHDPETAS